MTGKDCGKTKYYDEVTNTCSDCGTLCGLGRGQALRCMNKCPDLYKRLYKSTTLRPVTTTGALMSVPIASPNDVDTLVAVIILVLVACFVLIGLLALALYCYRRGKDRESQGHQQTVRNLEEGRLMIDLNHNHSGRIQHGTTDGNTTAIEFESQGELRNGDLHHPTEPEGEVGTESGRHIVYQNPRVFSRSTSLSDEETSRRMSVGDAPTR